MTHLLNRLLRLRVAMMALLLPLMASAQQNCNIDIQARYHVDYRDMDLKVGQKWAAGEDTATLYYAWQRWKNEGMSYATFRNRSVGTALAKEVAWFQEAPNNLKSGYQNTFSFGNWPAGKWKIDVRSQVPRGGMRGVQASPPSDGEGPGGRSFAYYGNGADHGQVATEFVMDDANWWPANETERRMFETPNASRNDNNGYNESFLIENIRLTGPSIYGDGKTRIGLFIKRAGECSWVNQVRSDSFQYGFVANDGVPLTIGTISAFWNEIGGFVGLGTALATINIQTLSGDGNGEMVGLHPGYDAHSGGRLHIDLLKYEDGTTQGARLGNGCAGFFEGQYLVDIDVVNFSNDNGAIPRPMFIVNPTLGNGANQNSLLRFAAIGFKYTKVLRNMVTGAEWNSPGDYAGFALDHYAKWDKIVTGCEDLVKTTGGPQPGTWTCTAWSACANGSQTRTCTCTGTCPQPTRTETQSCTTPPPPPVTMLMTAHQSDCVEAGKVRPPSAAVDGIPSTFWMSCAGMTANGSQWVRFDLGSEKTVGTLTFTVPPGYNGSYPRTFTWQTSANASTWTSAVSVAGTANSTAIINRKCRYIWVKCTAANGNWWGIGEATVTVQ